MKVTILSPVQHDGKALDIGAVVDLPKAAALALVACGSAEEGGKAGPAKPDAEAAAKADAIAAAEKVVTDAHAAVDAAGDADKATAQFALGAAMVAHANLQD